MCLLLTALALTLSPCRCFAFQEADAQVTVDEGAPRIIDDEAFDEIVLDDENSTVVRIRPLELPKRKPVDPKSYKKGQKLVVRQIENPTEDYEVKWGDIAEVRLFEYMVLDKVRQLVREGKDEPAKFDEAYDYFDFLKREYPNLDGLTATLCDYLYADAGHWHRLGKYENALSLLNEIYEVDPKYASLQSGLGATTQKLLEPLLAADDYPAARRMIGRLAAKFAESPVVTKYRQQWAEEARQLIEKGRGQIADGHARDAWEVAQRVLYVWPSSPEAKKFFDDLYAAWPRVVVGVTSPSPPFEQSRLASWSARRDGRLLNRLLLEFTGPGAEGGQYTCPFGQIERTDIGQRLIFRIKRDIKSSSDGAHVTGYDVARQLVALADGRQPGAEPTWADLFGGVSVLDVYQVDTELRWSYVQPLALLETAVTPANSGGAADAIGPYTLIESKPEATYFQARPAYFAAQPTQPKEIVERRMADSLECYRALDRGRVEMIDRLAPWEIERYQENREFVVEQYALPTVHCLAPNFDRPFMQHRCYRRALAYAVNRQVVLEHHLLRDKPLPAGFKVVTGPFPIGNGFDDPLRYAYNVGVEERPRYPRLAIALSQVALHDLNEAAKKRGEPELKACPKIVLAHPAHDIAREACKGIQRHIQTLKFTVELRELPPGVSVPTDGEYDLLYMEIMAQEPLVDAARLLGPDGILRHASPYMTLALVQLAKATNWKEARLILERIHQLTADDVAVIPLWQMPEFFAYHKSLKGIGKKPVLLYQHVEEWQGSVRIPKED
ncbi:MAG TPA: ABC transporter substrate-binding protein [Pirellulales bacterium]